MVALGSNEIYTCITVFFKRFSLKHSRRNVLVKDINYIFLNAYFSCATVNNEPFPSQALMTFFLFFSNPYITFFGKQFVAFFYSMFEKHQPPTTLLLNSTDSPRKIPHVIGQLNSDIYAVPVKRRSPSSPKKLSPPSSPCQDENLPAGWEKHEGMFSKRFSLNFFHLNFRVSTLSQLQKLVSSKAYS